MDFLIVSWVRVGLGNRLASGKRSYILENVKMRMKVFKQPLILRYEMCRPEV